MELKSLSDLIATIYDCALDPDRWVEVVREIAQLSQSAGCRIVIDHRQRGQAVSIFQSDDNVYAREPPVGLIMSPQAIDRLPVGIPALVGPSQDGSAAEGGANLSGLTARDAVTMVLLNSPTRLVVLEAVRLEHQP